MRRRIVPALLALFVAPASVEAATPVDARGFIDTIGVNTHLHYSDTVYGNYPMVQQRLQELGVRHIRDGFDPARRQWFYDRVNALGAVGIKSTLINCRFPNSSDWEHFTEPAKQKVRDSVEALQGVNEPNLQDGGQHDGGEWWNDARGCDYWSYQLSKGTHKHEYGDPLNVPIYTSAVTGTAFDKMGDLSGFGDGGSMHSYPGNQEPSGPDYYPFSRAMAEIRQVNFGGRQVPVIATETGYHNAINTTRGHHPVSEKAAGIYMPRLFLEYARAGVERTFTYELVDRHADAEKDDDWKNFGLFRNDWSYKPAATAIKNMIALLDSPSASVREPLGYTLTNTADPDGSGSRGAVRDMLMQKADGSWWLALWQTSSVWNGADVVNPLTIVDVTLDRTAAVTGYRPTYGTGTVGSLVGVRSFRVRVNDDAILVKIKP